MVLLFLIIGVFIGIFLTELAILLQSLSGTLNIESLDNYDYLFLALNKELSHIANKKYVMLQVRHNTHK